MRSRPTCLPGLRSLAHSEKEKNDERCIALAKEGKKKWVWLSVCMRPSVCREMPK